jgi:integrase
MPDGTRVRKYFAEEGDAIRERADLELKAVGQSEVRQALRTAFTPAQLADAEAAAEHAGSLKLSKIVAHYITLRDRVSAKNVDLDQAIAFVEARYHPETKAITILNAKEEFLVSKVSLSPKTRLNYENGIGQLLKPDPNKFVHAYTVSDIEKVVQRFSNLNTRKTHRRVISVFFNWAVRHHYCLENPCDRLDKLPRDMSQITALSLEESKRLFYAAMQLQDGAAAACVAIGMFAGLRPSEIRDLTPADILKEKIRVSGGKLRRQIKRSVPIPPVLAAWLKEFPFKGLPPGWDGKLKRLKKATKARKWVQDIVRHTSITFQAERDKNEALTAYNCGTSKQMMDRHYRDLIDDEKSIAEFWNLTPAKLRAKPPKVDLETKRRVEWPDKKALTRLVWQKPLMHAARDIGVSDVALKKHCVKIGIELPRQGHWLRQ